MYYCFTLQLICHKLGRHMASSAELAICVHAACQPAPSAAKPDWPWMYSRDPGMAHTSLGHGSQHSALGQSACLTCFCARD